MKIKTNFLLIGLLSLLIGTAFASPLLLSELEIRPGPGLPEGPKADFSVNVVYANFSLQDNANITVPDWYPETANLSAVSYFVVLNITNHSDEAAVIMDSIVTVAGDVSKGVNNGTWGGGGWFEGAWLDGEWVNVTLFPSMQLDNGTWIDGYLQEGVYVRYGYSDGELTTNSMYIDGSWVDVTGRINVTLNEDIGCVSLFDNLLVSHFYLFQNRDSYNASHDDSSDSFFSTTIWSGPEDFNNTWAPHQSRLIAFTGAEVFFMPDGLEALETGTMYIQTTVSNRLVNNLYNGTLVSTWSTAEEIKQIQLEITEDGYVYNFILSDDQMFVTDSFGVEVFIEPRS